MSLYAQNSEIYQQTYNRNTNYTNRSEHDDLQSLIRGYLKAPTDSEPVGVLPAQVFLLVREHNAHLTVVLMQT